MVPFLPNSRSGDDDEVGVLDAVGGSGSHHAVVSAGNDGFCILYPFSRRPERYSLHMAALYDAQERPVASEREHAVPVCLTPALYLNDSVAVTLSQLQDVTITCLYTMADGLQVGNALPPTRFDVLCDDSLSLDQIGR